MRNFFWKILTKKNILENPYQKKIKKNMQKILIFFFLKIFEKKKKKIEKNVSKKKKIYIVW